MRGLADFPGAAGAALYDLYGLFVLVAAVLIPILVLVLVLKWVFGGSRGASRSARGVLDARYAEGGSRARSTQRCGATSRNRPEGLRCKARGEKRSGLSGV